jgi:hypothetical protein
MSLSVDWVNTPLLASELWMYVESLESGRTLKSFPWQLELLLLRHLTLVLI